MRWEWFGPRCGCGCGDFGVGGGRCTTYFLVHGLFFLARCWLLGVARESGFKPGLPQVVWWAGEDVEGHEDQYLADLNAVWRLFLLASRSAYRVVFT
jgi:hypothetical protein